MENGECSFIASSTKYKRRKVSAIRDFPQGCGNFVQQVSLSQTEETEATCSDTLKNSSCKEGNSDDSKNITLDLAKDLHQLGISILKEEKGPVLLDNNSLLPTGKNDIAYPNSHVNENCKEGSSDGLNNGASDLAKDLHHVGVATPMEDTGLVHFDDNFMLPIENTDTTCTDTLPKSKCKEASTDDQKNETSDLVKDLHLVGNTTPKKYSSPVRLDGNSLLATENIDTTCMDTLLDSNCKEGSSDGLKNGTSDLAKGLHLVDVATSKEEMGPILLDDHLTLQMNGSSSVSNVNGFEKILSRNYPPRRRVSAIRDFPKFCGINASPHSKEKPLEELASLENKNSQEKSGFETNEKVLSETVKQTAGTAGDAVDGDLFRSKLVSNDMKVTRDTIQHKDSVDVLSSVKNLSSCQEACDPEMDDKFLTQIVNAAVTTALKVGGEDLAHGDSYNIELERSGSKVARNEVRPERERSAVKEKRKKDECVVSSERTVEKEKKENINEAPFEEALYWWDHEFETVLGKDDSDAEGSEENLCQEMVVYSVGKTPNEMLSVTSKNQLLAVNLASDRMIVQGLMAASQCPWRQGKSSGMSKPAGMSGIKRKKIDYTSQVERSKMKSAAKTRVDENDLKGKPVKMVSPESPCQGTDQLVIWDEENSHELDEPDLHVTPRSRGVHVFVPPLHHGTSSSKDHDINATVTRNKVRETLRLFQAVCRKLLQEEEAKSKQGKQSKKRVDYLAAKILKDKDKCVNTGKQILGAVPGVEVGDEFQYRLELNIIGLHRQIQGGIDYVKHGGKILATSIVASGGYSDDLDNSDVLVYTGQGGNVMNSDKEPEDQKLERGNLALKNSMDQKNPVRVIRGCESSEGKSRTYVYDGLYLVEKSWQELGPHGKLVFKFQLERIPGQPELAWKEVKKSKKFKVREGVCVDDISGGKEKIPICAVNTINDEKPPLFKYTTSLIYPDWYHPSTPQGCDCISGCSDSDKCSCAVKNGGEIPFNFNGAIVEAKSLVYECGPSCKCPPSCHNRVSQHGIKFQLEIFKTNIMGWGVRSLNFIPSGSFICEYIGELLKEKDAEERTGNDEYLFDIGNNYNDNSLWGGLSTLMPDVHSASCEVVEDGCFTIDAAEYGNIGRFVNHSCTPNLYAQNVLYDHQDKRIPHIMLFAAENIPPLKELTYHYNYTVDEVRDSNGNIKKKSCFCGSPECSGRLY
ncbi:uncharacterized protein LOC133778068 [Humulus lupulus]|uniref:uncharacterized protein LOC133778068 n=1 Tax=Humulus lupulus TaxID=3486 RepID=UPI002B40E927|nr:uncharacterized protein LOC133778068 [Humulus lupulus]